jgi:Carboxylesterase family/Secretion system C-terminal sorting domain
MKFILTLSLFIATCLKAQVNCNRYANNVYSTYSLTSNIVYGASTSFNQTTPQPLKLDFYEPDNDTSTRRPLIIWAHGGSFMFGTKTDIDVSTLSQRFAKKGFACASIDYRLGVSPFDSVGVIRALARAMQDMKAAIRFFYKDKLTANIYKIDTNNIFIGGSSAGAITALHTAYLNKTCEINPYLDQTALTAIGGLDGYSGNECYSSKVKGVINLCGALGKYGWIEMGDVPLCSMHGTNDAVVPYGQGKANPGIPIIYLDGSRMIYAGTQSTGVAHSFYTWFGSGHVPYAGTSTTALAYMDTTVNFVRDFLIGRLGCSNTALQLPNTPMGTVTPYSYVGCNGNFSLPCSNTTSVSTLGLHNVEGNNLIRAIYPNPSFSKVTLAFVDGTKEHSIQLVNLSGKRILSETCDAGSFTFEKGNLEPGLYFLKVISENGNSSTYKLVFE